MMFSAETHRAYRESVKTRRTFFETSRDYSTHANPRDAHARPESGMSAMLMESTFGKRLQVAAFHIQLDALRTRLFFFKSKLLSPTRCLRPGLSSKALVNEYNNE